MEIVINECYGGFSLSKEAYEWLGLEWDGYGFKYSDSEERTDPKLIECVKTLKEKADGRFSSLRVVKIPEEATDWKLDEYDGAESIICVIDGKIRCL